MKTLLIILSLLLINSPGYPLDSVSPSLLASNELSWVDEQVQAIKPSRSGMNKHELAKISDPFIFLKKNRGEEDEEKKTELNHKQIATIVKPQTISTKTVTSSTKSVKKGLVLEAVLNKSVMINGMWYKLKENVSGYRVSEINRNSVLLTKNKKHLLLTTKTRNTKIKFQK